MRWPIYSAEIINLLLKTGTLGRFFLLCPCAWPLIHGGSVHGESAPKHLEAPPTAGYSLPIDS